MLALVFALALAAFYVANALAEIAIYVLSQHVGGADGGFGVLDFHILGTEIYYAGILQGATALLLIAGVLYVVWRLTRSAVRTCPECHSEVPRAASVCRYCTADLPGGD